MELQSHARSSRNRIRLVNVLPGMEIPRVGPLGLVHRPEGYTATARSYPTRLRVAALAVLGAFVVVSVVTTAYSLGAYCLTTWGGSPFTASGY